MPAHLVPSRFLGQGPLSCMTPSSHSAAISCQILIEKSLLHLSGLTQRRPPHAAAAAHSSPTWKKGPSPPQLPQPPRPGYASACPCILTSSAPLAAWCQDTICGQPEALSLYDLLVGHRYRPPSPGHQGPALQGSSLMTL